MSYYKTQFEQPDAAFDVDFKSESDAYEAGKKSMEDEMEKLLRDTEKAFDDIETALDKVTESLEETIDYADSLTEGWLA